jgi:hypothetical protein
LLVGTDARRHARALNESYVSSVRDDLRDQLYEACHNETLVAN